MADNLTGAGQTTGENRTDWSPAGNGGLSQGESALSVGGGGNSKTAGGLADVAHEYTDKVSDAVSQAKDYLGDKVNSVGGKIKEFATDDLSGLAEKAKDFARENPGQAILVSAAAGVLLGLMVRGRR
jgi:ElaB/YqjD/DUF883 family membrane-anchored ribosome-binding protein